MTARIYIQLLDEGSPVWRPTCGEEIEPGVYRVLPTEDYDPETESWEFPPGSIVKCVVETRTGPRSEQNQVLVARQRVG